MFTSRASKMFIVLLVLVAALATVSFVTRSANVPTADRSYDSLEQIRALRPAASVADASYDMIETVRVQRSNAFSVSAYDAIEQVRLDRAFSADRSYDNIEALRLQR